MELTRNLVPWYYSLENNYVVDHEIKLKYRMYIYFIILYDELYMQYFPFLKNVSQSKKKLELLKKRLTQIEPQKPSLEPLSDVRTSQSLPCSPNSE